jgi:hypothetical protein
MLYIPGDSLVYTFRVPDADGNNISGLTWTKKVLTKGVLRITSGDVWDNWSIAEHVSNEYYGLSFIPAIDEAPIYMVAAISDAAVPDTFELHLEPDWAKIILLAEKIEHGTGTPETVSYYMPDGTTLIRTFNMTTVGATESRDGA